MLKKKGFISREKFLTVVWMAAANLRKYLLDVSVAIENRTSAIL